YNFSHFFVRRTNTFHDIQKDTAQAKSHSTRERAKELQAVLKCGAIVNQLYGGWKLVVEDQKPAREQ
ncbi:hypothetical protein L226DRAFT_468927, partial [Lentinus tigrinus ALCF2SS1-7]|uniref:uncharacterized protein n=1 Tax=Lentinus tigrinus ALCF2SS1-7 TaxID=1328758 RepID=UPI0011661148